MAALQPKQTSERKKKSARKKILKTSTQLQQGAGQQKQSAASALKAETMVVREQTTARLDAKIQDFKKKIAKVTDVTGDGAKLSLLKSHFNSADMACL